MNCVRKGRKMPATKCLLEVKKWIRIIKDFREERRRMNLTCRPRLIGKESFSFVRIKVMSSIKSVLFSQL